MPSVEHSGDVIDADAFPDIYEFTKEGVYTGNFFHSFFTVIADDPNYHSAGDQAEHVQPTRMAEVADLGLAVIDLLLSSR